MGRATTYHDPIPPSKLRPRAACTRRLADLRVLERWPTIKAVRGCGWLNSSQSKRPHAPTRRKKRKLREETYAQINDCRGARVADGRRAGDGTGNTQNRLY